MNPSSPQHTPFFSPYRIKFIQLDHLAVWHHVPKHNNLGYRIFFIHGLSEHSLRHVNTFHYVLNLGLEVVRFDLRGMGRSGGERQWIKSFDEYREDIQKVYEYFTQHNLSSTTNAPPTSDDLYLPPSKSFLLGHSLGGAIAIHFVSQLEEKNRPLGLILSSPAYLLGPSISKLKIKIGEVATRFFPGLRLSNNSDLKFISRDPKVVKEYLEDPLAFHFNTLSQGKAILDALPKTLDCIQKIAIPTAFFHGTLDKIIPPQSSFELLKHLPKGCDKELHYFLGGYHELHNDFGKEDYFQLLKNWLFRHISCNNQA